MEKAFWAPDQWDVLLWKHIASSFLSVRDIINLSSMSRRFRRTLFSRDMFFALVVRDFGLSYAQNGVPVEMHNQLTTEQRTHEMVENYFLLKCRRFFAAMHLIIAMIAMTDNRGIQLLYPHGGFVRDLLLGRGTDFSDIDVSLNIEQAGFNSDELTDDGMPLAKSHASALSQRLSHTIDTQLIGYGTPEWFVREILQHVKADDQIKVQTESFGNLKMYGCGEVRSVHRLVVSSPFYPPIRFDFLDVEWIRLCDATPSMFYISGHKVSQHDPGMFIRGIAPFDPNLLLDATIEVGVWARQAHKAYNIGPFENNSGFNLELNAYLPLRPCGLFTSDPTSSPRQSCMVYDSLTKEEKEETKLKNAKYNTNSVFRMTFVDKRFRVFTPIDVSQMPRLAPRFQRWRDLGFKPDVTNVNTMLALHYARYPIDVEQVEKQCNSAKQSRRKETLREMEAQRLNKQRDSEYVQDMFSLRAPKAGVKRTRFLPPQDDTDQV